MAGETISAAVTSSLNYGGLDFGIYDSYGVKVKSSSDNNITDGQTGVLDYQFDEGGVYYLIVWEYSDAIGSYDLVFHQG